MKITTRMMMGLVVRAADDAEPDPGHTTFIASTADPDRAADIVEQTWKLEQFKANPVIMWAHRYDQPPIGKAVSAEVTDAGLKIRVKWDMKSKRGEDADRQYREGYLNAVSVGFRPGEGSVRRSDLEEGDERKGAHGLLFRNNELLELSATPVPMNGNALAERAVQLRQFAERVGGISEPSKPVFPVVTLNSAPVADPATVKAEVLRLLREDPDVQRAVGASAWAQPVDDDDDDTPDTLAAWLAG